MTVEQVVKRIETARKQRKLTQTKMAKVLGVSQGVISKIENREHPPSLSLWLRFQRRFEGKPC